LVFGWPVEAVIIFCLEPKTIIHPYNELWQSYISFGNIMNLIDQTLPCIRYGCFRHRINPIANEKTKIMELIYENINNDNIIFNSLPQFEIHRIMVSWSNINQFIKPDTIIGGCDVQVNNKDLTLFYDIVGGLVKKEKPRYLTFDEIFFLAI